MFNPREKLIALIEESTSCIYGGEYGDETVDEEIDINDEGIARIADYLLANGVIVAPCKIGDMLFRIWQTKRSPHHAASSYIRPVVLNEHNFWRIVFGGEFGKTVFLTHKEAEHALAQIRSDQNG